MRKFKDGWKKSKRKYRKRIGTGRAKAIQLAELGLLARIMNIQTKHFLNIDFQAGALKMAHPALS